MHCSAVGILYTAFTAQACDNLAREKNISDICLDLINEIFMLHEAV